MNNNQDIEKIVGDYKYGFKTDVENVFDTGRGISEDVVRLISKMKNEPEWMLDIRLKAYHEFAKMKWMQFIRPEHQHLPIKVLHSNKRYRFQGRPDDAYDLSPTGIFYRRFKNLKKIFK